MREEPAAVNEARTRAPGFDERLLAEALRRHEEAGRPLAEPGAELRAVSAGGDFERRIVRRSTEVSVAPGLVRALGRVRSWTRILVAVLAVAGVVLGIAAANAALVRDGRGLVNFYWALMGLLGVHSAALALWLVAVSLRPGRLPATPFGALLRSGLAWLVRRERAQPYLPAALSAWAGVMGGRALARWALSALVHGVWTSILAGMLAGLLVLLSARQYDFVWETTILPDRVFVDLTGTLGGLPSMAGFAVPDRAITEASRRGAGHGPPPAARSAWSGLLIGALLLYAMVPRLLLLGLSWALLRRARSRFRLDLDLPGYARLRPHLLPGARHADVVDPDGDGSGGDDPRREEPPPRDAPDLRRALHDCPEGVAFLGLEIPAPSTGWPPPLVEPAQDLGLARDRDGRRAVLEALGRPGTRAPALFVVCSLAASPDRGLARFVGLLRATHRGPLRMLLTGAATARARLGGEGLRARESDWRRLARVAGLDADGVHLLDLDDPEAVKAFHFPPAPEESRPPRP